MADRSEWFALEGRNPVIEALAAGVAVKEVLVVEGAQGRSVARIEEEAARRRVPVKRVKKAHFEKVARTQTSQGVVALMQPIGYRSLDDILMTVQSQPGLVLVCDGIVDPRNLGALIRAANAAGAHGVIVPKNRAVGMTPGVFKASAGAALHTPVAQVTNLARTLRELKDRGYWVAGATMEAATPMWEADFRGPTAIVVGGEDRGLSRLIRETCDVRVSIPMAGAISSLNASVAGAILLYEAVRQRRGETVSSFRR